MALNYVQHLAWSVQWSKGATGTYCKPRSAQKCAREIFSFEIVSLGAPSYNATLTSAHWCPPSQSLSDVQPRLSTLFWESLVDCELPSVSAETHLVAFQLT